METVSAKAAEAACRTAGIKIERKRSWGIMHFLYTHRKRPGLFIGALLAAAVIALSDDYLWAVEIEGCDKADRQQVEKLLAENGLYVGKRLDELDVDRTETLVLLASDEISWMSINLEGTCARVQVREAVLEKAETSSKNANIVAARDGVIEYFELFSGVPAAEVGQAVRKGELLISGIREDRYGDFTAGRAAGRVMAVTERELEVFVPLVYTEKSVSEGRILEKSLIFFSKEIKIFKRGSQKGESCDTIDNAEMLHFFGEAPLPVGIRTVREAVVEETEEYRSEAEAEELAYQCLARRLTEELSEAEILKKTLSWQMTEEGYLLSCRLKCIEDIAAVREFDGPQ